MEGSRAELAELSPLDRVHVGWEVMRLFLAALPADLATDVPSLPAPEQVWPICREHGCLVTFDFDYAASTLEPYCSAHAHRLTRSDLALPA